MTARTLFWRALLLVAWVVAPVGAIAQDLPVVRIGIVIDGPWESNDELREAFEREILELAEGEFDVRFPEDKTIAGDWSVGSVERAVDQLLADKEVDLLLTLGVIASNTVAHLGPLPKPTIAPIIVDAQVQDLPREGGSSGIKNLNYIAFPNNILRDMKAFLEIVSFERVAIFVNANTQGSIPDYGPRAARILEALDVKPQFIPVGASVDEAISTLEPGTEAVYLAPLLHLSSGEFDLLVRRLIERKLPSFSLFGEREVDRGVLATLNHDVLPRLSRRVALNVQRILLGEEPGDLETTFQAGEQLTINMETARAIGVYPSWDVLTEAQLINDQKKVVERSLNLSLAIEEALIANLELAVRDKSVSAAEQDIKLARANLLPQIDLSLLGTQVDRKTAEQSVGQQAEQTVSGSITLDQIIYSEPAWANYTIQKRLQASRERDRDVLGLDIAQEAATAYLDVLSAKTFESIQRENLRLIRQNLDMARVREAIGTARPAEVLRWESEIANSRRTVINSNALRNVTEIQLNRLLNRPEEESFMTEETDINDPALMFPQRALLQYISNPWDFRIFRAFMVQEGLATTPEIAVLTEAIAAQERATKSAGRSFWVPSLGLRADFTHIFAREGAGSEIPPDFADVFPPVLEDRWSVALDLRYGLFLGGSKFAERRQALDTLGELRLQLASTSQLVSQRIRSSLHVLGASYAAIKQSRLAADAAIETLKLVRDSYSQGAVTILDLLDAQNNALISELEAATAVYTFLIDLMESERSVGKLIIEMSDEERNAFFDRLDKYFELHR